MTTILIATQQEEVQSLLPWATHLARSRSTSLTLLLAQRRKGETRIVDLQSKNKDDDSEIAAYASSRIAELTTEQTEAETQGPPVAIGLFQIAGERWSEDLGTKLAEFHPTLVIAPAPTISKEQSTEDDWQTAILTSVDCDVMLMRDDSVCTDKQVRAVAFISEDADNEVAFGYALHLVESMGGTATAVYIEPNVGDHAASVGRRQLCNELKRFLRSRDRESFEQQVIVAGTVSEAFRELNPADFDILLMGTHDLRQMRRFLRASHSTSDMESAECAALPAVAVIRKGESLSNRLYNRADRMLRGIVPQLSREDRIELVSRIQDSSKWDFDFVFLISLATLIGCLGLAEDSSAVIVGAMLVAPLMTPIAGVGLGVAHANAHLTKVAFRTALRGFVTALVIGVLFGFCVQACNSFGWLTPLRVAVKTNPAAETDIAEPLWSFPLEMEKRRRPQFYDLLIALTSGVAAAYAMGRPNLFSALPGVAIAAALVPPIATSGIALSYGDVARGGGALLLFVTNMVTIILGASLIFRAVGIRSQKEGPNAARWPRLTLLLLMLLSVLMTVIIEFSQRRTN